MNPFLVKLSEQRRRFLDGLDANEGEINLGIFEDFYPDQAHFVFELLQNAEDALATETMFTLQDDGCFFEHDGERHFTEDDVRSITGIDNSTKKKAPDQIGKFGIGFKSVFVYTQKPTIFSRDFSFSISRYVLPEPVPTDPLNGTRTSFWLPFDNPKKPVADAYDEVKSGLTELDETTLLFLSRIRAIRWQIGTGTSGVIRRVNHSEHHVEVLKDIDGITTARSHFLRFEQPVEHLSKQRVAIAFELNSLPNVATFDSSMPLHKQFKITPATRGRVAVFFPADKETSGLRFHLHGPFVPELSRASIKETRANQPLFDQLAKLTASALHLIRDAGLLNGEFLAVLPNPHDPIALRYQGIRSAVIDEMNNQPLTPTYTKKHAPAKCLLQAKAALKELFSEEDLEFLIAPKEHLPQWGISASQKNSNMDRFLEGLKTITLDLDALVKMLCEKGRIPSHPVRDRRKLDTEENQKFMHWLKNKSPEWHQALYAYLYSECSQCSERRRGQLFSQLRALAIVRLSNASYSVGEKCFFPSDGIEDDDVLPRVDSGVYTSSRNSLQQEYAKKFLEHIGVRDVGEAEQVEAILRKRYTGEGFHPDIRDLGRFVSIVEKEPRKASMFADFYIFERTDGKYGSPSLVFLDRPFLDTGLAKFYEAVGEGDGLAGLAESYKQCGVSLARLVSFAQAVGVETSLRIVKTTCQENPEWSYLSEVAGRMFRKPINEDFKIQGLEKALARPSLTISKLIWQTMCSLPQQPDYLHAIYQKNEACGPRRADSQLVHELRRSAWVPQGKDLFVRPMAAFGDLLPDGFLFDPNWPWIKAIHFGTATEQGMAEQVIAHKLGFRDQKSLERARRFAALSAEEQDRILTERERVQNAELPDQKPSDLELRMDRVAALAAVAPERTTEQRTRSVSVGREEVKAETEPYLRQQYTGEDGMICQVCKSKLPFKLDDGSDFFEKVEFLPELTRRHYQNYLALCPNHAAMFRHANASTKTMLENCVELTGSELPVVLGQRDSTIYFTETHITDLKAVIAADRLLPTSRCQNGQKDI